MRADVTKPAAGPEMPAQTDQFVATLAAEVWLVHGAVLRVRVLTDWLKAAGDGPGSLTSKVQQLKG